MRGFSSLNSRTLTYTDNRSPDVKTNYAVAFDISSNETTNTFLMKRSIEIEEIVKPEDANLIITIDTRAVSGVLVEWDALPAGVTTIDAGGLYIVNGVATVSDWNDIKEPTITVPVGYQGTFFYIVRLEWTTPTGQEYVEYTVGEYIPVSVLVSEFALAATPNRIVGVSATLPAQFGLELEITDIPLLVTTSIACQAIRIKGIAAGLTAQFTQNAITSAIFSNTYLSLVGDGYYDPFTETDISSVSPRITDLSAASTTVYDLEMSASDTSYIEDIEFAVTGYDAYVDQALPGYAGLFNGFIDNGTKLTTSSSGTARIYTVPNMSLIYSFTRDPDYDISFSKSGNWILGYSVNENNIRKESTTGGLDKTLRFEETNRPRAVALSGDGQLVAVDLPLATNLNFYYFNFISSSDPAVDQLVGTVPPPTNVSNWAWHPTEHENNNDSHSWVQASNSGLKFLVGGTTSFSGTLYYSTHLITVNNVDPFQLGSVVSFQANGINYKINDCVTNDNFTLLAFGNKLYNSSFSLIQTFNNDILAVSNDETVVVIKGSVGHSIRYTGSVLSGYTVDSFVYNNDNYVAVNSNYILSENNYAEFITRNFTFNETTDTLTITGIKTDVNLMLDTLTITADISPAFNDNFTVNYELTTPSITYTRRQPFVSLQVAANPTANFSLTNKISYTTLNSATLTANSSLNCSLIKLPIQASANLNVISSITLATSSVNSVFLLDYETPVNHVMTANPGLYSLVFLEAQNTSDEPRMFVSNPSTVDGLYYNCRLTLISAGAIVLRNSNNTATGNSIWITSSTSEAVPYYISSLSYFKFNDLMRSVLISQQSGSLGSYQLRYEVFRYNTAAPSNLLTSGTKIKDSTVTLTLTL